MKTIFALSTILGKSGVAIIRISGHDARKVLEDFGVKKSIRPGQFIFAKLFHPDSKAHLDDALVLYFQAPHSFTGDDTIEFHLHGSIAVVKDVISALGTLDYLRPALPGEFSRMAFFNNKLDLTKAEALVNLINSETTIQKDVALRQLGGQLENLYESWRKQMVSALAKLEALIDFPEDDIPESALREIVDTICNLKKAIRKHLATASSGEIITRGVKVAIIGVPNVGKSSLLNMLAKREIAIVSDIAGTTRDVIEAKLDLNGFPVIFYDTAGVRKSNNKIEVEGVKRALKISSESDINIYVLDPTNATSYSILPKNFTKPFIIIENKADLVDTQREDSIEFSAITGKGTAKLLSALNLLIENMYTPSHEPIITSERYKAHLHKCIKFLDSFSTMDTLEISAEYIRLAAFELGCIMGKIEVEEVLDELFSSFCIGK